MLYRIIKAEKVYLFSLQEKKNAEIWNTWFDVLMPFEKDNVDGSINCWVGQGLDGQAAFVSTGEQSGKQSGLSQAPETACIQS